MSRVFGFIGGIFKGLGKFLLPFATASRDKRKVGRAILWLVHFTLVVVLFVLLHAINQTFDICRMVRSPWPMLREFMLPILFLLFYSLLWIGWWLWKLINLQDKDTGCADIDAAWNEALASLDRAGISLQETPVFLIVGQTPRSDSELFDAAQIPLLVNQSPAAREAPLHVYANREAIFVACRELSLLARQASYLCPTETDVALERESIGDLGKTSLLGEVPEETFESLGAGTAQAATATLAPTTQSVAQAKSRLKQRLLKSPPLVAQMSMRLRHLCRLIIDERSPYCPVNGILLAIPANSINTEEDSFEMGAVARYELGLIEDTLQVRCPWSVLMESSDAPGFEEFVSRLPSDLIARRLGCDFPLSPDLDSRKVPEEIESSVQHGLRVTLSTAAYKLMEAPDNNKQRPGALPNEKIHSLLRDMHWRADRIAHVTTRALAGLSAGPPLMAGCFIVGTGIQSPHQRAFVRGVLQQAVDNQSYVSWTKSAIEEERDDNRLALFGYAGTGLLLAVLMSLWIFTSI
jgi:hypothetical protein